MADEKEKIDTSLLTEDEAAALNAPEPNDDEPGPTPVTTVEESSPPEPEPVKEEPPKEEPKTGEEPKPEETKKPEEIKK